MLVQDFLLTHSFNDLLSLHGVKARPSADGSKWSLNYDQILAKDSDGIACECRGLVIRPLMKVESLDAVVGETTILFRCMNRFFNLGDPVAAKLDWAGQVWAEDKMDGTMCGLYWDPEAQPASGLGSGDWRICTRSVPEADLPFDEGLSVLDKNTFYELFKHCAKNTLHKIYDAPFTDDTFNGWLSGLDKSVSYTYEATSPLNRIVVKYDDYYATLLAARRTDTGEYLEFKETEADFSAFKALEQVEDGWDGEEPPCPKPTPEAIDRAAMIWETLVMEKISVESIDPDVLGGVDFYIKGNRPAWIYVANNGNDTLVYKDTAGETYGVKYDPFKVKQLIGEYLPGPALMRPGMRELKSGEDITAWVNTLDPAKSEGVVLVDRHYNRVKVKSTGWVLASRAKDVVTMSRRGALETIIKGNIDDVLPLLDDKVAEEIRVLHNRFVGWLVRTDSTRVSLHETYSVRKDFALALKAVGIWSTPYFALYDRPSVMVHDWLLELDKSGKLTPSLLDSILEAI